jgi:hypothetical protein
VTVFPPVSDALYVKLTTLPEIESITIVVGPGVEVKVIVEVVPDARESPLALTPLTKNDWELPSPKAPMSIPSARIGELDPVPL